MRGGVVFPLDCRWVLFFIFYFFWPRSICTFCISLALFGHFLSFPNLPVFLLSASAQMLYFSRVSFFNAFVVSIFFGLSRACNGQGHALRVYLGLLGQTGTLATLVSSFERETERRVKKTKKKRK